MFLKDVKMRIRIARIGKILRNILKNKYKPRVENTLLDTQNRARKLKIILHGFHLPYVPTVKH